ADDTFDVVLEDGSLVRWNNQGNALVPAGYGAKPVVAKLVMATHRSGLVATAANGGVIKVSFNGPTQRSEVDLQGHTSAVVGLSWHPQGRRLASISNDRTVRIWDIETGNEMLRFDGRNFLADYGVHAQLFAAAWT